MVELRRTPAGCLLSLLLAELQILIKALCLSCSAVWKEFLGAVHFDQRAVWTLQPERSEATKVGRNRDGEELGRSVSCMDSLNRTFTQA